jgi:hypothetical protein
VLQVFSNIAISAGMASKDFDTLKNVCDKVPELSYICLDVANGYSEHFVSFIRRVRDEFPSHTIFAGNVVTGEMVEELILAGADVVKVCSRNLFVQEGNLFRSELAQALSALLVVRLELAILN